jgi:hypothetical protein
MKLVFQEIKIRLCKRDIIQFLNNIKYCAYCNYLLETDSISPRKKFYCDFNCFMRYKKRKNWESFINGTFDF